MNLRLRTATAFLGALLTGLAILVAPAVADTGTDDLPVYAGTFGIDPIESAADPEDYSFRVELETGETLVQVSEKEVAIERADGSLQGIYAPTAHDADGELVRTTLSVSEGDVLTVTVHHLESDYVYPVTIETGWILIFEEENVPAQIPIGEFAESENRIREANPAAATTRYEAGATCRVPKLKGLKLRAAKAKLRTAHCTIGKVHLAHGTTAGKGRVVTEWRVVGAELAEGSPVAVTLGEG